MKKPWNLPDLPVYSLATFHKDKMNMNICTYVTALSMHPKLYGIAVYENTQTLENITKEDYAVLQLLNKNHFSLVRKLGQTSGKIYNKQNYLEKKEMLSSWKGYRILKDIAAVVLLKKQSRQITGDHHLFVFEMVEYKSFHQDYLTLDDLRNKKIIRG